MRLALFTSLLIGIAGCQLLGDHEGTPKTYPSPDGSLPEITVLEARGVGPGSYRIRAYVTRIFECPPNARCFAPDHVTLADRRGEPDPARTLMVFATQPGQFVAGSRHMFSVRVDTSHAGPTGEVFRSYHLLGYD